MLDCVLVGKILLEKCISKFKVQSIVRQAWFKQDYVKIDELEPNKFLFSFKTTSDRNRV